MRNPRAYVAPWIEDASRRLTHVTAPHVIEIMCTFVICCALYRLTSRSRKNEKRCFVVVKIDLTTAREYTQKREFQEAILAT